MDYVLIASETVHTLNIKIRGNNIFMALKLDISKTLIVWNSHFLKLSRMEWHLTPNGYN